jgi:hypothetical protein
MNDPIDELIEEMREDAILVKHRPRKWRKLSKPERTTRLRFHYGIDPEFYGTFTPEEE